MSKSALAMDEQLEAFLLKWEGVRAGLVGKYTKEAEFYRHRSDMQMCYTLARGKAEHHQHELDMLTELRARSLP